MLNKLVVAEVDVASRDDSGRTPLHEMANRGNLIACKLLLDKGASVHATRHGSNVSRELPLHEAIGPGDERLAICKLFIEAGSPIDEPTAKAIWTPLHFAACHGAFGICKLLLSHGAGTNYPDELGRTPLFLAAERNYVRICSLLLEYGARLNVVEHKTGQTVMHAVVCVDQNVEACRFLLSAGADASVKDNNGWTPRHMAEHLKNKKILAVLDEMKVP